MSGTTFSVNLKGTKSSPSVITKALFGGRSLIFRIGSPKSVNLRKKEKANSVR
eukprot:Pgem_evm1s925